MVKKLQKMAEKQNAAAAGLLDNQLAQSVRESAQQIWLAGMGAFAKAQAEGGKVFEALVKEGTSLQRKTQGIAGEKLGEVTSRMTAMADGVTAKAGQQWDKLESIFEERVAKAMGKLGVPSSQELQTLVERIDALSAQVEQLGGKPARAAAKTPAKAARSAAAKSAANGGVKPSAKRSAARKNAA
jgi:poly(hydroxyalkanoate) granule-associated protein